MPNAEWRDYITKVAARTARGRARKHVLEEARPVLGLKELARMERCGSAWVGVERLYDDASVEKVWRQAHCGSRYCPICAARETAKKADEISARVAREAPGVGLLGTITVGRPVTVSKLRQRKADLRKVWASMWPRLKAAGCQGGVYSYEATRSAQQGDLIHLHMHVWTWWSGSSPVILRDTSYVLNRRLPYREFTPMYLQWTAWVEQSIQEAAPRLWERLKPIEETWRGHGRLEAAQRVARVARVDLPRRWVSADLGGRFPGRPCKAARAKGGAHWVPLTLLAHSPKEALKYALKGLSGEAATATMALFKGARRFQPFGIFMRAPKVALRDARELTETRRLIGRRLTGEVLFVVGGRENYGDAVNEGDRLAHLWFDWSARRWGGLGCKLKVTEAAPRMFVLQWVDSSALTLDIPWGEVA